MGKSVSGILETFYGDILDDYPYEDGKEYEKQREMSFLYRAFWAENVSWLLKRMDRALEKYIREHGGVAHNPLEKYIEPCGKNSKPGSWDFPWILAQSPEWRPTSGTRIRKQLAEAMKDYPEWAGEDELLLGKKSGKGERRDFWEKLWCDDARYRAGLLSDSQYYRWLAKYLAARDIYYKDTSMCDGHVWLYTLLLAGLKGTENELQPGQLCRGGRNIRTKTEVGQDLEKLAKLIEEDRGAEIDARLHDIGYRVKTGDGEIKRKDYLLWLNARLERLAIHIKIRTWLQDSGHSAGNRKGKENPKKSRKREFSLQLFERYCDSDEGYEFTKKRPGYRTGWEMDGREFCVFELSRADELRESLEQSKKKDVYIPLAVHMGSGCVFFLAGKENYREVYDGAGEELRKAYEEAEVGCCFDYLRPDKRYQRYFPGDPGGAFRLQPTFHENQGRSCRAVFEDFKRACLSGENSFLQAVRDFNEEAPADIPDVFRGAFEYAAEPEEKTAISEKREPSPQSKASFCHTWETAGKDSAVFVRQ